MFILWIRKKKADRQDGAAKQATRLSQKQEDAIQQFRLEHPDIAVGSASDIVTGDGNLLATVEEVTLWPNIQN
jgi:hypothetical protein